MTRNDDPFDPVRAKLFPGIHFSRMFGIQGDLLFDNKGFQVAGRIGRFFDEHFSAGISGGIAPYLEYESGLPSGVGVRDPKHVIGGIDVSARFDKLHNGISSPTPSEITILALQAALRFENIEALFFE